MCLKLSSQAINLLASISIFESGVNSLYALSPKFLHENSFPVLFRRVSYGRIE